VIADFQVAIWTFGMEFELANDVVVCDVVQRYLGTGSAEIVGGDEGCTFIRCEDEGQFFLFIRDSGKWLGNSCMGALCLKSGGWRREMKV
jgi:hypothetical protein